MRTLSTVWSCLILVLKHGSEWLLWIWPTDKSSNAYMKKVFPFPPQVFIALWQSTDKLICCRPASSTLAKNTGEMALWAHRQWSNDVLTVSHSTIKRARYELGWVITSPKYCQLIRDLNKAKRLEWCKKITRTKGTFDNVFTDECSVML